MADEPAPGTPPLFVVAGPTSSGKTAIAIDVAVALGAEIISADSQQVYRGADIATAKPTPAERERVPHHLIDVVDPDQQFTVAQFVALADRAIADIAARGRRALLVGGTGLYIRALIHGLVPLPPANRSLRRTLEARATKLHSDLARVDLPSATRIAPTDTVRLVRALEVFHETGQPLSALTGSHAFRDVRFPHRIVALSWPRDTLRERIRTRAHDMVRRGLFDEVTALTATYGPTSPLLRAIGFGDDFESLVRRTTSFAKRQETWLRKEPGVEWVAMPQPTTTFVALAKEFFEATWRR